MTKSFTQALLASMKQQAATEMWQKRVLSSLRGSITRPSVKAASTDELVVYCESVTMAGYTYKLLWNDEITLQVAREGNGVLLTFKRIIL